MAENKMAPFLWLTTHDVYVRWEHAVAQIQSEI